MWQTDFGEKTTFSNREVYKGTSEGGNGVRIKNNDTKEENHRFSSLNKKKN